MNNSEAEESFKMDRSKISLFNSIDEANADNSFWLDRPVEERLSAIEFLRAQWIELNNLPTVMDRKYFEIR